MWTLPSTVAVEDERVFRLEREIVDCDLESVLDRGREQRLSGRDSDAERLRNIGIFEEFDALSSARPVRPVGDVEPAQQPSLL